MSDFTAGKALHYIRVTCKHFNLPSFKILKALTNVLQVDFYQVTYMFLEDMNRDLDHIYTTVLAIY